MLSCIMSPTLKTSPPTHLLFLFFPRLLFLCSIPALKPDLCCTLGGNVTAQHSPQQLCSVCFSYFCNAFSVYRQSRRGRPWLENTYKTLHLHIRKIVRSPNLGKIVRQMSVWTWRKSCMQSQQEEEAPHSGTEFFGRAFSGHNCRAA